MINEIIGNTVTREIILEMVNLGLIPKEEPFEISQKLLDLYYEFYAKKHPEKAIKHRKTEIRYYKKLTGLSLLKLSLSRIIDNNINQENGKNKKPTLTWKVKCSDKQLTLIVLKSGAMIEKILDNDVKEIFMDW
jgi:hypothetical protein